MGSKENCAVTIYLRREIRDQFQRFCNLRRKTQAEVLEEMILSHCVVQESPQELLSKTAYCPIKSKQDFIAHLCACFETDGGELKKEASFFRNDHYCIHLLYRKLGHGESKVINASSGNVLNLLSDSERFGRTPLIAVFAIPQEGEPVLGLIDPRRVPRPCPEMPGRKMPIFLRENNAVYIHLRNEQDLEAVVQLSRQSLPDGLFSKIYNGG